MGDLQTTAEGMIMNDHEKEKEKQSTSMIEQDKVQDNDSNTVEAKEAQYDAALELNMKEKDKVKVHDNDSNTVEVKETQHDAALESNVKEKGKVQEKVSVTEGGNIDLLEAALESYYSEVFRRVPVTKETSKETSLPAKGVHGIIAEEKQNKNVDVEQKEKNCRC
jgi:hypothetical protein